MSKSKQELQKEIADLKAKMAKLEEEENLNKRDAAIKSLSEYTNEEKIAFFDKMYKSAEEELETFEEKRYHNEDYEHYGWEDYIKILAKDQKLFWEYWNSIYK
jgi:hypothetical protein